MPEPERVTTPTGVAGDGWGPDVVLFVLAAGLLVLGLAERRRRVAATHEAVRAAREFDGVRRDMIANVSHELYTPLTPLIAYLRMLRSGRVSKEKAAFMTDEMLRAATRLEGTIDLLVGYATLQNHGFDLRRDQSDVAGLLRFVATECGKRFPDRRISVEWRGPAVFLPLNEWLVRNVAAQLVENAAKFSPAGEPVRILAGIDADRLAIAVEDRGPGIPPERLAAAVDAFRQLDSSSTREAGGIGLGLTFVNGVARAYGGSLRFDARGGRNVVTFAIPATSDVRAPRALASV